MSVKRYDVSAFIEHGGESAGWDAHEVADGLYVLASDYDAKCAEVEALRGLLREAQAHTDLYRIQADELGYTAAAKRALPLLARIDAALAAGEREG